MAARKKGLGRGLGALGLGTGKKIFEPEKGEQAAGSSSGKMGSDWAAQPERRRSRSGVKYSLRMRVVRFEGKRALSSSGMSKTSMMSRSSGAIFTAAKTLAPMARAAGVQKVTAPPALRSSAPV